MQTLKYCGQLGMLWGISLLGGYLASLTDLPIPGNVLGVVILFSLLCLGVIKVEQVEGMADFLLKHLVFFFIPIVAGLMEWGTMFREHGPALALTIVASSLATLFVCAWLTLALRRKE
ncbi:MAG: CidA/LrgA family protein [Desulfovibrionaceae bacterium]|nr:CidA/LrgA family protein [Desulfovibrionaceae bacterium]